jgi:hypothetical protein
MQANLAFSCWRWGLVAATALSMAACDGAPPKQAQLDCQQAAFMLVEGAKCVLGSAGVQRVSATPNLRVLDGQACTAPLREFREWGLGAYDAEEILRSNLDAYFKKYKQRGFCQELKVHQSFGYSSMR